MDLLLRYDYPGNVRELQNIVERAVVMARGELIMTTDLPIVSKGTGGQAVAVDAGGGSLPEQVESLEREAIVRALEEAGGVQSRAAEALGITERNMRYKLKKYGLK